MKINVAKLINVIAQLAVTMPVIIAAVKPVVNAARKASTALPN